MSNTCQTRVEHTRYIQVRLADPVRDDVPDIRLHGPTLPACRLQGRRVTRVRRFTSAQAPDVQDGLELTGVKPNESSV